MPKANIFETDRKLQRDIMFGKSIVHRQKHSVSPVKQVGGSIMF